jgi:hypothetical protein
MFMNNPWQHHKIGDQHSSIISVYSPKCLAKLSVFGSTTLHVLLEGLSLRDGLSGIVTLNRGWVTGVCLSSTGPAHGGGLFATGWLWVRVWAFSQRSDKGWLGGRGESRSGSNKGEKSNDLLLATNRVVEVEGEGEKKTC